MQLLTIQIVQKTTDQERRTIWPFASAAIASDSPTDGHQFYSTLENTAHSYQIVQVI
jgi:hypothetical protein